MSTLKIPLNLAVFIRNVGKINFHDRQNDKTLDPTNVTSVMLRSFVIFSANLCVYIYICMYIYVPRSCYLSCKTNTVKLISIKIRVRQALLTELLILPIFFLVLFINTYETDPFNSKEIASKKFCLERIEL